MSFPVWVQRGPSHRTKTSAPAVDGTMPHHCCPQSEPPVCHMQSTAHDHADKNGQPKRQDGLEPADVTGDCSSPRKLVSGRKAVHKGGASAGKRGLCEVLPEPLGRGAGPEVLPLRGICCPGLWAAKMRRFQKGLRAPLRWCLAHLKPPPRDPQLLGPRGSVVLLCMWALQCSPAGTTGALGAERDLERPQTFRRKRLVLWRSFRSRWARDSIEHGRSGKSPGTFRGLASLPPTIPQMRGTGRTVTRPPPLSPTALARGRAGKLRTPVRWSYYVTMCPVRSNAVECVVIYEALHTASTNCAQRLHVCTVSTDYTWVSRPMQPS